MLKNKSDINTKNKAQTYVKTKNASTHSATLLHSAQSDE